MHQKTISRRIECTGVGLHSGKTVTLALRPAAEDSGIVFHVSTPSGKYDISPVPEVVIATGLATTLGNDKVSVSTVEHLLGALRGMGVDNVHIDVQGGEVPILDGSAGQFVELLSHAGLHTQAKNKRVLRIKKPVTFRHEGKSIKAEPYHGFCVDYTIDFPHPVIGRQRLVLDVTPRSFASVAKARTFGFLHEVEMLKERGLALGGSLNNAIVLDERGVLNKEGLRHADEFVRHKVLDFIGDMAMMPLPLQGHFTVECSGHALNNQFLRHLSGAGSQYLEMVTLSNDGKTPKPLSLRRAPAELQSHAFAG